MSSARRPAKWRIANLRCAAQNRPPLQRWSTPPFSRTTRLRAHRAGARHAEVRHVALARARHARHDFRDDVAGAAHDHVVADANALSAHLEQVVQRRVRDRRSADEDRLELGDRRQLAGAADLDLDRVEARRLLLRRVLLRHRPARLARLEAEPLLQGAVVDLVDDAVDLVRQRVRASPRSAAWKATSPAAPSTRSCIGLAGRPIASNASSSAVCVGGTSQPTTSPRP